MHNRIRQLFVSLTLLTVSDLSYGQDARLTLLLQSKIDSISVAHHIPAMAFSCMLPNGDEVSVAYGMNPGERMLSGSTGKTFFAALALTIFHEKNISLDEKVAKYLRDKPWYIDIPNNNEITIRMLMNHTSGIEEYYELGNFIERLRNEPDKIWLPEELISYALGRSALFPAGSDWSYADTNYLLLGVMLEELSGQKAYEQIIKNFLTPYKLNSTTPSDARILKNLVTGFTIPGNAFGINGPLVQDSRLVINPQFEWAGGGFVSNTSDLAKWANLYYKAEFLSEELRMELRKGVPAKTGNGHQYGLGMQIRPSNLGTSYGHGGWFPGYLTEMDFFPDKDISVAVQIATDDFSTLKRSPRYFELFFSGIVATYLRQKH